MLDELNPSQKEGIILRIGDSRAGTICHVQICTKLIVTNEGKKAYSIRSMVS